MSVTHTITRSYKDQSSVTISLAEQISDNMEVNFDQLVPIATNTPYVYNLTRANLKSLCLYSDQAITIKTNSSGAPTDTITLAAGQTLVWTLATDTITKCPISADITAGVFITNSSSASANVKFRAVAHQ